MTYKIRHKAHRDWDDSWKWFCSCGASAMTWKPWGHNENSAEAHEQVHEYRF